ncbi:MAG: substrate-binding domain-containing protein, partial [Pseudomonadota bacterium]
NDLMAMRGMEMLEQMGLRIPEDISVAGYDNDENLVKYLKRPLTTVTLPYREMGRVAVDRLFGARGPLDKADAPTLVSGNVVERATVLNLSKAKRETTDAGA